MPKSRAVAVRRGSRRIRGRGKTWNKIKAWLSGANTWLKKSKILSTLGNAYASTGLPYAAQIGTASGVAQRMGYGRKRVRVNYNRRRLIKR